MTNTFLAWFVQYGALILVIVLLGAACAVPLPASLVLITAGSLTQDVMPLWQVYAVGIVAAIAGDHLAYVLGRSFERPLNRLVGQQLHPARHFLDRWGMLGIFFSRWLITAGGGVLNLLCGITRYPVWKFSLMVMLGEILWVVGYASLGYLFQAQVAYLNEVLGNVSYAALGLIVMLFCGVKLVQSLRRSPQPNGGIQQGPALADQTAQPINE